MWCAGPQVEEIHTTLRKHLRKEEEQLLPLLVAHFSTAEQAELVAQFLCSIPLSTVEVGVVLAGVERHRAGGTSLAGAGRVEARGWLMSGGREAPGWPVWGGAEAPLARCMRAARTVSGGWEAALGGAWGAWRPVVAWRRVQGWHSSLVGCHARPCRPSICCSRPCCA